MLCFTTAANHLILPPPSSPVAAPRAFPSILFIGNSRAITRRLQGHHPMTGCSLILGFSESREGYNYDGLCCGCSGFARRCKDWDGEGDDFTLEAEILEFMKSSKKPQAFPSKKELLEAGREDLVDAITKKGGWLSLGWDLEEEDRAQERNFRNWDSSMAKKFDSGASGGNQTGVSGVGSSILDDSSQAASSSGRSLDAATTEDNTGIAGILNRLEKQRNLTLGFTLREKEDSADDLLPLTSSGPASVNPTKAIPNDSRDRSNHNRSLSNIDVRRDSPRPDMWRTWSTQRGGVSDLDFEADEFSYDKTGVSEDVSRDRIFQLRAEANKSDRRIELDSNQKGINHEQIRSHIKHPEPELISELRLLRSKTDEAASQEGHESTSADLRNLADAWEFQENEIMHAQDKLRSTRAKLAVLEGKVAMAIIEAQKIVEEKQKRISDARRALQLLRNACIVYPNSASEVLIAGSYDGWTTQRKMEKSRTGVFSLSLKLYPGRYEIKFIADGEWRVDPLRPIVRNNGYENNVLIIT